MTAEYRASQSRRIRTEIAWLRADQDLGGPNADEHIAGLRRQLAELAAPEPTDLAAAAHFNPGEDRR